MFIICELFNFDMKIIILHHTYLLCIFNLKYIIIIIIIAISPSSSKKINWAEADSIDSTSLGSVNVAYIFTDPL